MRKKQLHYEIIDDGNDEKEQLSNSTELEHATPAVKPERDAYAELIGIAQKTERVKFRVKPDHSSKRMTVGFVLGGAVLLGAILIGTLKNGTAIIVVSAFVLAAVIGAIIGMCVLTSAQNGKNNYCWYVREGDSVLCLSVIGNRATLFANGVAYRIDGDEFYTLDGDGFITYLEGECSGLVAILSARRDDVSVDDNVYNVKNAVGGGHTVYVEDGKIAEIVSDQPRDTGVDEATGMSVIKTDKFVKTEPVYDFEPTVPEFVSEALRARGINVGGR